MDLLTEVLAPIDVIRIFLGSGLGKLGDLGMAQALLGKIDPAMRTFWGQCGLPTVPAELAGLLANPDSVREFLKSCPDDTVCRISGILDFYRGGGVGGRIARHRQWTMLRGVAVEKILLSPSEFWLHALFFRNGHRLVSIAADKQLWQAAPYSSWSPGRRIEWPICLAERMPGEQFRIIDGTHRSLQMMLNGEKTIDLCCPLS